jgi:hypothetical protein
MFQQIVRLAALSGLLFALAACGTQASAPTQPTTVAEPAPSEALIGEQFELTIGERVTLAEAGISLSFAEVVEDSRCPADAMCVQQGRAVVSGDLTDAAGAPAPYTLTLGNADDAGAEIAAGDYTVRIVALDPYPGTVDQVNPEDYRLTLLVEKAGA